VGGDDPGDDRQSEAGATALPTSGRTLPPEALEDLVLCAIGDARPVIADRDAHLVVIGLESDFDRCARGRMDGCVGEQVGNHLPQLMGVAEDLRRVRSGEGDAAVGCGGAGVLARIGDQLAEIDALTERLAHLVEAGEAEQVVDHHAHPHRLLLDPPHRHLHVLGLLRGTHPEHLRVAADRGERRTQLVRGIGEKAPHPLFAGLALGECLLDLAQHRIQGSPQSADLGAWVGLLDPLR